MRSIEWCHFQGAC